MKQIFLVAGLLFPLFALAQQPPMLTVQPNTVYVGAEGRYEAAPDTALLQFNIAAQEDSAKGAYERASNAAEQVRQILRSNSIDPKAAEFGFFSLDPVYDYRSPKRKLVAYRVSSSVSLKLKEFAKVAPILQQLADMDVTANQSLSYMLDNLDEAKIRAVQDAFQRARSEAQAVATAGGRTLGELSYSSVDTNEPIRILSANAAPRAMMAAGAAPAAPPSAEFTPQKITVTAHVNALFTLR